MPAKSDPVAVTVVPEGPTVGSNVRLGARGTLKVALPVSPVVPVTCTVYGPLVPDATVNDPDIAPPATVHNGLEMRPLGVEEIVHPVSPGLTKFEPETRTFVPERPEPGNKEIPGVNTKLAVPKSPRLPVTVTV